MSKTTSHPLPSGTAAVAYSIVLERRPFIEGRTRIISPIEGEPNLYGVRFAGEALTQVRFVHPDWQRDPTRILEILTAYWRLSCDGSLSRAAIVPLIDQHSALPREAPRRSDTIISSKRSSKNGN